jgi:flagellar basal-body rod protein FlgC
MELQQACAYRIMHRLDFKEASETVKAVDAELEALLRVVWGQASRERQRDLCFYLAKYPYKHFVLKNGPASISRPGAEPAGIAIRPTGGGANMSGEPVRRAAARPDGKRPVMRTAGIRPLTLKLAYGAPALGDGSTIRPTSPEPLMSSISTIALSGMNAAVRRLEVSASNVANIRSTGALPGADGTVPAGAPKAYAPLELVQTASAGGGTQTSVTTAKPSTVAVSDPQVPFADENGFVAAPNVDLGQEMISQLIAKYSFAANAHVMKADDEMSKTLLDMRA